MPLLKDRICELESLSGGLLQVLIVGTGPLNFAANCKLGQSRNLISKETGLKSLSLLIACGLALIGKGLGDLDRQAKEMHQMMKLASIEFSCEI